MDVREPALPVDPSLPGEPTVTEVAATRAWLARRGVLVDLPTRLLALRVGAREWNRAQAVQWGVAVLAVLGGGNVLLHYVPAVRPAFFAAVFAALTLTGWYRTRVRERIAERLVAARARPPLRETAMRVGGWYITATAITFAGGAAGCVTEFLTDPPDRGHPVARTLALVIGALATAPVLAKVLRGPAIAEDGASLAVDGVLRAQDAHRFAPAAVFAFLTVPDVPSSGPGPAGWVQLSCAVLAIAAQVAGWLLARRRYRHLPPGYYGRVSGSRPS